MSTNRLVWPSEVAANLDILDADLSRIGQSVLSLDEARRTLKRAAGILRSLPLSAAACPACAGVPDTEHLECYLS